MSPCTLLVDRELAITLPASCLLGRLSGIRSSKLVSTRLKAVVCELAMLPEMFSSAKDWARMPVTAVVRAPKIPITRLHLALATGRGTRLRPQYRGSHCKPHAKGKHMINQCLMKTAGAAGVAGHAAHPAKISRFNPTIRPARRPWA